MAKLALPAKPTAPISRSTQLEEIDAGVTVSAIVVDCVKPVDVPEMVTVEVPVVAAPLAISVSVLVAVAGFGLNEAVTPPGRPEADRLTFPLKPFCGVTVMVLVPLAACVMLRVLGEDERAKLGAKAAVTVSVTVVELVKLPEVPAIVTVTVPVFAALPAVNVKVLVLVVLPGLKEAVTPLGSPEADKLTLPLKPFCGVTVIVLGPTVPCIRLKLPGEAASVKLGAGRGGVVIETLSKVAVARAEVLPLLATRPMYTFCAMGIVWLVPICTQFTPSGEL